MLEGRTCEDVWRNIRGKIPAVFNIGWAGCDKWAGDRQRPDPVMFLGYWNQPAATERKFIGDWMRTGDLGRKDAAGYFWFDGSESAAQRKP